MAFPYENLIRVIHDYPTSGIVFQDITPVLAHPPAFEALINDIADHFSARGITKVIGAESRGFIVGTGVALRLDLGFVPARKQGKLPIVGYSATYDLEYGTATLELPANTLTPNDRILVVDDLLATGGTAKAIGAMVEESGAKLEGFGFFIELTELKGRSAITEAFDAEVYATCQRSSLAAML